MTKFEELSNVNVAPYVEKKGQLNYLSWANAWKEFCKVYPEATYRIIKNEDNLPFFKSKEGYMVYTEVTVGEITHEMWLPVMNYSNKAILEATMTDINKAVMRCLTKNLAMFGLGISLYTGEDLPEAPTINRNEILKAIPSLLEKKELDYYDRVLKYYHLPEDTPINKLSDEHLVQLYNNLKK